MLEQKFEQYIQSKLEIFNFFGSHDYATWLPIENHMNATKWELEHDSIVWEEDECEYGYDYVNLVAEKDGYKLYLVRDNGEKFYAIFKTK